MALNISFNSGFLHLFILTVSTVLSLFCNPRQSKMLYPNMENYCDLDEVSNKYTPSCLEKNCNQIFVKGQCITKEIYEKVNSEIVPEKTNICGKKMRIRIFICKYL